MNTKQHKMPAHAWVFPARCTRIVDGDSLILVVDLGFHLTYTGRFRLLDVDTPEPEGETEAAGDAATEFTRRWIVDAGIGGWPLRIQTEPDPDDFGRYLAHLWRVTDGRSLAVTLIQAGHHTGRQFD